MGVITEILDEERFAFIAGDIVSVLQRYHLEPEEALQVLATLDEAIRVVMYEEKGDSDEQD